MATIKKAWAAVLAWFLSAARPAPVSAYPACAGCGRQFRVGVGGLCEQCDERAW